MYEKCYINKVALTTLKCNLGGAGDRNTNKNRIYNTEASEISSCIATQYLVGAPFELEPPFHIEPFHNNQI